MKKGSENSHIEHCKHFIEGMLTPLWKSAYGGFRLFYVNATWLLLLFNDLRLLQARSKFVMLK